MLRQLWHQLAGIAVVERSGKEREEEEEGGEVARKNHVGTGGEDELPANADAKG